MRNGAEKFARPRRPKCEAELKSLLVLGGRNAKQSRKVCSSPEAKTRDGAEKFARRWRPKREMEPKSSLVAGD